MADPPKGGASKPRAIPPPPPDMSGLRGKGLPPAKLPEASAGVVTGASTSAPALPPGRDLPTLAPPRRKGSEPPPPDKKIVEADDIDIELDALIAADAPKTSNKQLEMLPASQQK